MEGRLGFGVAEACMTFVVLVAATGCLSTSTRSMVASAEREVSAHAAAPLGRDAHAPAPSEAELAQDADLPALEAAALARNPRLVAAARRVYALTAAARAEASLPPPELMTQLWQVPIERPYRVDQAQMWMLSLRQSIPAGGSLDAVSEATASEAQAAAAMAEAEARALIHEVDRAFADYAEATSQHAAHVAHRALLEQLVRIARARYESNGTLADVAKAELELASLEAHIAHEHGMIEEARAELNGLLAREVGAPLGAPRLAEPETVVASAKQLAGRAASKNPSVVASERSADAAQRATRIAEALAVRPSFTVAADGFLPVGNMPAGWGAEFGMSLPWLSSGGAHRTASAEQRALAEKATAESTRTRVRADVATSLARVSSSARRLLLVRERVKPAAARALDVARAGYAAGGTDILSYVDAARSSVEVDLELATARGDLERALADLDFAAGERVARSPLGPLTEISHD